MCTPSPRYVQEALRVVGWQRVIAGWRVFVKPLVLRGDSASTSMGTVCLSVSLTALAVLTVLLLIPPFFFFFF